MSRNQIVLSSVEQTATKTLASTLGLHHEVALYRALAGTGLTPEFRFVTSEHVVTAFSSGIPLNQCIPTLELFHKLAQWHIDVQRHMKEKTGKYCVLEDGNLGNFLLEGDRILGIDFEHWHNASLEEAFAPILAQIQCMNCQKPLKAQILYEMNRSFFRAGANEAKLIQCTQEEIRRLLAYRQVKQLMASTTAALLLGGEGKRLGGVDKSKLMWGEFTFLEQLEYQLGVFDQVLYSVRKGSPFSSTQGPVVEDSPVTLGPAAGLVSLLQACETEYLFVWPCDMPFLHRDFLIELFRAFQPNKDGLIPETSRGIYPLSGIYACRTKAHTLAKAKAGNRAIRQIIDGLDVEVFPCSDKERALININTREDMSLLHGTLDGLF